MNGVSAVLRIGTALRPFPTGFANGAVVNGVPAVQNVLWPLRNDTDVVPYGI